MSQLKTNFMKIQLLGYLESKEHHDANPNWEDDNYSEHDSGYTCWSLFFKGEDKSFKVDVYASYGSCGSGYCSASWGSISKIEEIKSIPDNLVKTKGLVYIDLLPNNILNVTFQDPNEPWDAEIETLLSTKGVQIAQSTGNGGCNYYPSGNASINLDLFEF